MANTDAGSTGSSESGGSGMANLSPPWYTTNNMIAAALSGDSTYKVQPISGGGSNYTTTIQSSSGSNPQALASILKPSYQFSGVTLTVRVLDQSGKPVQPVKPPSADALLQAVKSALGRNSFFVQALISPPQPWTRMTQIVAVFTKSVLQFYNDDLSDYYRNYNGITADVFEQILTTQYTAQFSLATTTQNQRNVQTEGETGGEGGSGEGGSTGGGAGGAGGAGGGSYAGGGGQ